MREYVIFSDSSCDISPELLKEWGVVCIDLTFRADGSNLDFTQADVSNKEFYDNMRDGTVYRTSAANSESIKKAFERVLKEGKDIFYLGFSSGLSGTVGAGKLAAEQLAPIYPDNRIIVIDSLCASAGEGLLLYFAVEAKRRGGSIDEVEAEVNSKLPRLCHWFTVEDLVYLKRGGRVSATAAFFGGMLNIKPVLHVDNDGLLIPMLKVRGRNASLKAMAKKFSEMALDPAGCTYFISHGDSIEDAKKLESMIANEHGNHAKLITDIGPVIGAHSGPGTIALFFEGKER